MEDWTQNIEVIWNEDKTQPIGMIVNGEKLTIEEYHKNTLLMQRVS
jgi:hypothetical protein